ncbi:hypothetical protein [Flavobacterium sp. WG21]|uniref:hypothetical protein n=1 Tax=Flavobacterium sp. WG21 TaxID=1229487 RepID=UPI000348A06C|nr:hypothetical protein [Flavobacterium sp. WG21]
MKPLKLYIDNCSLNDIAPKGANWGDTDLGKYLLRKSMSGDIEVFSSPAGVIEIALNKDLDQRNNMAKALNTLIRGQRMMASKEYYVVDDFLRLIETTWNATTKAERMTFLKANSSRIYIALLGQLAALKDYDCTNGFINVIAPKLATQIIHSQIFENPKEEIEKRINAIKTKNYTHLNYYDGLTDLTIPELEKQQKEYEAKSYIIPKNAVSTLQKNQEILIEGYSLDELSFATDQVFVYWEDLAGTITNFPKIVAEWSTKSEIEKEKKLSVKPLDGEIVEKFAQQKQTISDCKIILKSLVHRFHTQTTFTRISNYIIIKDLEKGLKSGKIPSGGIILDSSHCIAALYNEILLSRDQRLNASVDFWFSELKKETGLFRETAKNLKELKRQVENGLKHS